MKPVTFSKQSLCNVSALFRSLLTTNPIQNWGGEQVHFQNGVIVLQRDILYAWEIIQLWVQDRDVLDPPSYDQAEEPINVHNLFGVYCTAVGRGIFGIRAAVGRASVRRLAIEAKRKQNIQSTSSSIKYLWKRTSNDDPMRHIVLSWLTLCFPQTKEHISAVLDLLPKANVGGVFTNRAEQAQPLTEEVMEELMHMTFGGFLSSPV